MQNLANAARARSELISRGSASRRAIKPVVVNDPALNRRDALFEGHAASVRSHAVSGGTASSFLRADPSAPLSGAASHRPSPASSAFTHASPSVHLVDTLAALAQEQRQALGDLQELHAAAVSAAQSAPPDQDALVENEFLNAEGPQHDGGADHSSRASGAQDLSAHRVRLLEARLVALRDRLDTTERELSRAQSASQNLADSVQNVLFKQEAIAPPVNNRQAPFTPSSATTVGPMDAYVSRTSHVNHLASLQEGFQPVSFTHPDAGARIFSRVSSRREKCRQKTERSRWAERDREERIAIRSSVAVGPEARSPEQATGPLDKNGYQKSHFLAPDDAEEDPFSSDDTSTDDDSCTELEDGDVDSDEDDNEVERRLEAIHAAYERTLERCPTGELFKLSCSGQALAAMRETDVHIKRPTSRSHIVELILNNWLRCNLGNVKEEHVSEFLKQLRIIPAEYAISVYYVLTKRIYPLSKSFFKFLFRCVDNYLPEQRRLIGRAYRRRDCTDEDDAAAASSAKPAATARKPTTKPPSIADIADIVDAVGRFYNDYRAYDRDHAGFPHKSVFDCFTPSQAATFSAQSRVRESVLAAMAPEPFMEVWRATFGLRSSAAVLAAIKRVQFRGNILDPAVWSTYHQNFTAVLHQAPKPKFPLKIVAETFIKNCRNSFLQEDILAYEPSDHDVALQMVLDRINDSGFLQSEALRDTFSRDRPDQPRYGITQKGMIASTFHGGRGDGKPNDKLNRHLPQNGDKQPRPSEQPSGNKAPSSPAAAPSRAALDKCSRCGRSGHTIDACICKHDADGNKLDRPDDATYAKRKANATALATARMKAVHAILSSEEEDEAAEVFENSDTSDVDEAHCCSIWCAESQAPFRELVRTAIQCRSSTARHHARSFLRGYFVDHGHKEFASRQVNFEDFVDTHVFVPASASAIDDVPPPSLLLCGDIESNPGPPKPSVSLSPSTHRPPPTARARAFRPLSPAPDLPALISDSDTSDSSADIARKAPFKAPSTSTTPAAPTVCATVKARPADMPALVSDSDTSDSSADEARTASAARTPLKTPSASVNPTATARCATILADMPALISDSDSSDSIDETAAANCVTAFLQSESSDSDTSDVEAAAHASLFPAVCSASPVSDLLPPPRFVGFIVAPGSKGTPPATHATLCAVDSMCQGTHSVIAKSIVDAYNLPTRPFAKTCRTATGARVSCTHMADFLIVVRIRDAWLLVPATALVWEQAAEPLLICNKLALDSGLIDFCQPNETRVPLFGETAFSANWKHLLDEEEQRALAIYHDDFMPEECDDVVDLSAPLKSGDQDTSSLPPTPSRLRNCFRP